MVWIVVLLCLGITASEGKPWEGYTGQEKPWEASAKQPNGGEGKYEISENFGNGAKVKVNIELQISNNGTDGQDDPNSRTEEPIIEHYPWTEEPIIEHYPWTDEPIIEPYPWTDDPYQWTDNPQPWTDNPKPWTDDPKPWTDDPYYGTDDPYYGTDDPYSGTEEPNPRTYDPYPWISEPYPWTNEPYPWTDEPYPWTDEPIIEPYPWTNEPHPWTDDPRPWTDNPRPWTDDPRPWTDDPHYMTGDYNSVTDYVMEEPYDTTNKPGGNGEAKLQGVDAEYKIFQVMGKTYVRIAQELTWDQAREKCQQLGESNQKLGYSKGDLASMPTYEEFDQVAKNMHMKGLENCGVREGDSWIGLKMTGTNFTTDWHWLSGGDPIDSTIDKFWDGSFPKTNPSWNMRCGVVLDAESSRSMYGKAEYRGRAWNTYCTSTECSFLCQLSKDSNYETGEPTHETNEPNHATVSYNTATDEPGENGEATLKGVDAKHKVFKVMGKTYVRIEQKLNWYGAREKCQQLGKEQQLGFSNGDLASMPTYEEFDQVSKAEGMHMEYRADCYPQSWIGLKTNGTDNTTTWNWLSGEGEPVTSTSKMWDTPFEPNMVYAADYDRKCVSVVDATFRKSMGGENKGVINNFYCENPLCSFLCQLF